MNSIESAGRRFRRQFGPRGVKIVLDILSECENNWQAAARLKCSLIEVRFLRDRFQELYAEAAKASPQSSHERTELVFVPGYREAG